MISSRQKGDGPNTNWHHIREASIYKIFNGSPPGQELEEIVIVKGFISLINKPRYCRSRERISETAEERKHMRNVQPLLHNDADVFRE